MASSNFLHFISLLFLFLVFLPTVFGDCKIPPSSWLSANSSNTSSWTSQSEEFAFGFRSVQLGNDGLVTLLAIWFAKLPDETIVWWAKDSAGSTVNITNNGIVVYDREGKEKWRRSGGKTNGAVSCASMEDNGNFVLLDDDNNIVWQSFDEPTDTLLPGQNLTRPTNLTARKSDTDFSDGNFKLRWQGDFNLVLYYYPGPNEATEQEAYWTTMTFDSGSRVIFNKFGQIYIENGTGVEIKRISSSVLDPVEFNYRATIGPDGAFRLYKHRKEGKATAGSCNPAWESEKDIPGDQCLTFTRATGNVFCGFNSYCSEIDEQPQCDCLDHFDKFTHENLVTCRTKFPLPNCQDGGWEMNEDQIEMREYEHLDWPLSDYDLKVGTGIDKDTCKNLCAKDCFCATAIYYNGSCWKKKYPLSNGRKSNMVNRIALFKVPKEGSMMEKNDKRTTSVLVISILLGSSVFFNIFLLIAFFGAFFFFYHRKLLNLQQLSSISAASVRSYTYKELEEATGGFKQELGKGAFGTVYKGVLGSDTRRFVAVKKLDKVIQEGEKEFKTEVSVIGQTHHRNLVRLLGYCDEGENRLLVYEYMSNGSLASWLFGISRPHWNQRVQIALGIARGLTYLHEECSTQIIHCDIKPQNILLDELFTPRISDFGLAKLLLAEQTRVARTNIRGTVGYFAPEWFRRASITTKVDVYSFGVMLLEIICCKSSVAYAMGNQEDQALMDWAYDCYTKRRLFQLVDNDEEAKNDMKKLEKLVMVAIWCVQEDSSMRPSMKKVMQMLEDVTEVTVPPCPSVFISS